MRFRLLAGDGTVIDQGEAEAGMAGGALVVTPPYGPVLRVAAADVVEVLEPEPYTVRLRLSDGGSVELSQLGRMRTQVLAELADARVAAVEVGAVGTAEAFPGAVDGVEAELLLYDDALVTVAGATEKVPYPFIGGVRVDGYTLIIDVVGRDPLVVGRLARRTSEFVDLLQARVGAAAGRTAHFLAALLPGLGPLTLRSVAGLIRDGLGAARSDLDKIDPTVLPALLDAATRPDRVPAARHLLDAGQVWVGFKQLVSVERPAEGGQPWRDPAVTPIFDHGGPSGFGGGFGGMMAAGLVAQGFGGPFPTYGATLAYGLLGNLGAFGSGSSFAGSHPVMPRANTYRPPLKAAHTDYDALTASGDQPAVLAFLLCRTANGRLVYEVLNVADHPTYVFREQDVARLNRDLDRVGFREGPVRSLENLIGRVDHSPDWAGRLDGYLA